METKTIIQVFDVTFSVLLMVSYWIASKRNEGMMDSLQFNLVNIVASCVFITIAISLGVYGYALRQLFFLVVSVRNIFCRYRNLRKVNGRAN